jgi:hypothetical protein
MEYAIQTLEIEIARIRQALRIASSTTKSYEDGRGGSTIDYMGLEAEIRILEKAIEVIKQWEIDNPLPENYFRHF